MNIYEVTAYLLSMIVVFFVGLKHNWWINKKEKEWKFPKIKDGKTTIYGWVVRHPENFCLGRNTDIGFGTYIQAKNRIVIGRDVKIGAHCAIYSENTEDGTSGQIYIDNGACIGAGSVILPKKDGTSLTIGKNSKVAALSVVKEDVPENSTFIYRCAADKDRHIYDRRTV